MRDYHSLEIHNDLKLLVLCVEKTYNVLLAVIKENARNSGMDFQN